MTYPANTSFLHVVRCLVILLCACPLPAWALGITTFAEYTIYDSGTVTTVTDPNAAATGGITSQVIAPVSAFTDDYAVTGNGPGTASAGQNVNGLGAVLADSAFASGNVFINSMTATATWSDSVTNNGATPQAYDFSFLITPAQLALGDFAGASVGDTGAPEASYNISILLGGTSIFESSAKLEGGNNGHLLTKSGTDLGSSFFSTSCCTFGYDFGAYTDTLSLGTLNPGASLSLVYIMTVNINAAGFELGGRAAIGDPFDLAGTGSGGVIAPAAIPLPAALPLMLTGLGLLSMIGTARRKKAA